MQGVGGVASLSGLMTQPLYRAVTPKRFAGVKVFFFVSRVVLVRRSEIAVP